MILVFLDLMILLIFDSMAKGTALYDAAEGIFLVLFSGAAEENRNG